MPVLGLDLSDQQTWDNYYEIQVSRRWYADNPTPSEQRTARIYMGYSRYALMPYCRGHVKGLTEKLGLNPTQKIAIIGAGFGWEVECFQELLPGVNVIAVDTGAWIQSAKNETEFNDVEVALNRAGISDAGERTLWHSRLQSGDTRAQVPILNEDITKTADRNRIKTALGSGQIDWAISIELLPWLTDTESLEIDSGMRGLAKNTAHFLTPFIQEQADRAIEPNVQSNWKTGADWKTLLPDSAIITVGNYEVF